MSNEKSGLEKFKHNYTSRVQKKIEEVFNFYGKNSCGLIEPMKYSSLNGGKYIRSLLVYATGATLGINEEFLDQPAIAIELTHAYTLIHDDLPCMDDDEIRRGAPSCHIAFNESSAILAGDALQSLAFQILSQKKYSQISSETLIPFFSMDVNAFTTSFIYSSFESKIKLPIDFTMSLQYSLCFDNGMISLSFLTL